MNVRHQLLEDFKFKPEIREVCDGAMAGMHKPIALHVRRTDYAQYNHHPIVSLDYYEEALSYFDTARDVIIFSDDPEWCHKQKLFSGDRFMISESGDQYIDLCLMTQCLDFIIANSSFSWWGAWAFNNTRKGSGSTEEMVRTSNGSDSQYQRSLLRRLDETMRSVAIVFIGTNRYLDFLLIIL